MSALIVTWLFPGDIGMKATVNSMQPVRSLDGGRRERELRGLNREINNSRGGVGGGGGGGGERGGKRGRRGRKEPKPRLSLNALSESFLAVKEAASSFLKSSS